MDVIVEDLKNQVDAILATAIQENRDLTLSENVRCEILLAEMATAGQSAGRQTEPDAPYRHPSQPGDGRQSGIEPQALFKDLATGEVVNGYRGTAPLNPGNVSPLGDALRGILLNDFSGLPNDLQASLTTGSDSGGGYLVTPQLSQRVIDLARANSVIMRAGATTIPMGGSELSLARVTADPSVAWRGETGAVTASTPTFGKYTLRPKTCAAIVPVSMELLEDTPNAGSVIESALMSSLGAEVDRAILEGVGAANQPLGIVNNTEVNSQASVGTPSNYSDMTTAITSILAANYPDDISDLAWIMNPTIGGTYDGLVSGITNDNTPLEPTPWVRQLQRFFTTNLAVYGSPQVYNMVLGRFSECLVGMRTSGVVIDVLDQGQVTDEDSTSWNATTQFLRFVRARIRIDALLMRPTWFTVLSGVEA